MKNPTHGKRKFFASIKTYLDTLSLKDGNKCFLGYQNAALRGQYVFFPGTPEQAEALAKARPKKSLDPTREYPDIASILPGRWSAWKRESCPPLLAVRLDRAAVKWLQHAMKGWARGSQVWLETRRPRPFLHRYTPDGSYAESRELQYTMSPDEHGAGDGWWWRLSQLPHPVYTAQEMDLRLYGEGTSWLVLHKPGETVSGVFLSEPEHQRYYALPEPTCLACLPGAGLAGGFGDRAVPGQEVVFHASTRGGRYRVVAMREADGTYSATWYIKGNPSGRAVGYNALGMRDRLAVDLVDSRAVDGINYNVLIDSLGVGMQVASMSRRRGMSLGSIGGDHVPPTLGGVLLLSSAAIGIACVFAARRLAP